MKRAFSLVLLVLLLFVSACSSQDTIPQSGDTVEGEAKIGEAKIKVYTSIYPMYDFAKKIGKDKIDLELMVPPGAEPHDWEPTAKLMAELENAHVLIYNGVQMEMWVDKVIGSLSNKDLIVVEASHGIDLLKYEGHHHHDEEHCHEGHKHEHHEAHSHGEHEHEHHEGCGCGHSHGHSHGHEEDHKHGEYDPHLWLDPIRAMEQARNIKNALIEVDEKNKDFYETNFNEFANSLQELDQKFSKELKERNIDEIVVAHAAFGYLTDRYGLKQIAISGLTPQEEPSSAKMAEITELVNEHGIKYIFYETLTSPKLAQVLAEETGASTAVLNPIEGVAREDMDSGKDYISIMEENLQSIKEAIN